VERELSDVVFAVNYLCRELLRDHAFRAAMKADPAAAIAKYDLTRRNAMHCWRATSPNSTAWVSTRFSWAICRALKCAA
jgi:hypothetical protein